MKIQALDEAGIAYRLNYKNTHIVALRFDLAPYEWVELCMREGSEYFGPCCGNTGECQDVLASVFRDSGWITTDQLETMYVNLHEHEGFEILKDPKAECSTRWLRQLSVMWESAKDLIGRADHDIQPRDLSDFDRAITAARRGLGHLSFSRLFSKSDEDNGQHRSNDIVEAAKALPALMMLSKEFQSHFKPFEGFVLVDAAEGLPMANRHGLCVYDKISAAQEVRGWYPGKEIKISACTITVEAGLTIGDELK